MAFKRATMKASFLRAAIVAPAGGGKTYTALKLARALVGPTGRIALIDSERGSASKYSKEFEFDVDELESFSPELYVRKIQEAEAEGYDICIIDSLSHAWSGREGALEQVDRVKAQQRGETSFTAWRAVTPMHNALVDAMLSCRMHLIATMRAKTEYVMEEYTDGGGRKKTKPVKVGMAPIQRDGMEYEFDLLGDMDVEHNFMISKTRIAALDGKHFKKPGDDLARIISGWLGDAPAEARSVAGPAPATPAQPVAPADPDVPARKQQYNRWLALQKEFNLNQEYLQECMSNWEIPEFRSAPPADLARMLDDVERALRQPAAPPPPPPVPAAPPRVPAPASATAAAPSAAAADVDF